MLLMAPAAAALGPTDPFELGFSEWEVFASYSGLGLDREESSLSTELLMGVGIRPRISGSLSITGESDTWLGNASQTISIGLFGVLLESDRVAWDLYGSVSTSGLVMAGTELSLSLGERAGAHLNLETGFENAPDDSQSIDTSLSIAPMVHYDLSASATVLAAASIGHYPDSDESSTELEAISLGVTFALREGLELETQADYYPSTDETDASAGLTAGLIACL
ncbi:hypothetical protein JW921_00580 [Candidatus Fermentibacterales bacterium]|nr:hypothetical protein [Candidatus Fermentibacterales bacterium]